MLKIKQVNSSYDIFSNRYQLLKEKKKNSLKKKNKKERKYIIFSSHISI